MNSSFSNALKLSGANPTTTYVLWAMIIFLLILVSGISFTVLKQLNKLRKLSKGKESKFKSQKAKGF